MQRDTDTPPPEGPVSGGGHGDTATVRPTLPPLGANPARLLALPGSVASNQHRDTVVAMVEALDPDAIVATPPQPGTVGATLPATEIPVLSPGRSRSPETTTALDNKILIATIPSETRDIEAAAVRADDGVVQDDETAPAAEAHRVCLTTLVSLEIDPYTRSAGLKHLDTYANQLPDGWLSTATHCSTALRAGYRTTTHVDGGSVSLVGIGQTEAALGVGVDDTDGADPALVEVFDNGAVSVESVAPEAFGLRGVEEVGEKRADRLRRAGYTDPIDVGDAPPHELADLSGLGRSTATTIQAAANAQAHDEVVPTGDDSLPYGDPIFIDIETDGREPSCAWLIGVLDGGPENGHYMAFGEGEPGDIGHLEAFLNWMDANGEGRPLVAWYGYNFDFPVLRDQIQQHCPEYLDRWDDWYQFDLLWWCRDKNGGNVVLPGRSNKLEPVAKALGWEPETTGIDGGVVAEVYTAYRREWLSTDDPSTVSEPDWDRLKRYCEDDVRALATIWEACSDAARREPGTSTESTDTGTQGALSDFS
ncbi:ribonuclease H-like domain-containing protein [Haloglomus halophilum]|uniref:ribonuclease H-like domain-containing protein n=1 Tax=Haloglomus halophilum TaxID=2962672 RepID=UPI0020C95468|nr:ribonuclease H-like domain-containing protein [Haloglomus halophilum]